MLAVGAGGSQRVVTTGPHPLTPRESRPCGCKSTSRLKECSHRDRGWGGAKKEVRKALQVEDEVLVLASQPKRLLADTTTSPLGGGRNMA